MFKNILLFDLKRVLCYKAVVFSVLLLLSYGLAANDLNLKYLPHQASKVGDGKYQLMKDFDTSVKQVRALYVGDRYIKEDLLTNEENFRIHVFYNLKKSAPWHKIYVISWDDKVFARVFK
ncbi:MAG TPA: hypothetical protein PLD55_02065 [bacterium]|jgi:hypothetical protein|nr:hypothetical protein [bacterium]HNZ54432.1 hypothetical protein [bacterium]HOB71805.1 hypothetical protein [bacterium]HOG44548.1 hypothetical protein [bacterium]HPV21798.1 hypothetical protein [bacterium]